MCLPHIAVLHRFDAKIDDFVKVSVPARFYCVCASIGHYFNINARVSDHFNYQFDVKIHDFHVKLVVKVAERYDC